MKSNFRSIFAQIVVLFLTVIFTACGGGGGGSDDGGGSGISYTGSTSQAVVTDDNADDIVTGAYQGGSVGRTINLGVALTDNKPVRPRTLVLSQTVEKSIHKIDITSGANNILSGAAQSESDTFQGDCGGSGSYNINYDDASGDFNGTVTYSDYCEDQVTLSGSMNFSGNLNIDSGDMQTWNCTLSNLTAITVGDNFTAEGSMTFDLTKNPAPAVLNVLLRDNVTSKVYKADNFNMTFTNDDSLDYADITISGTFYDPDYGYAVLSTSTPLRIYDTDDWPSQGDLLCTGNTGIAGGSTKAKLTALSSTQYSIEADTNGDESYDYDSGVLNWSEL